MKRVLSVLIVCLIIIVSLASCGSTNTFNSGQSNLPENNVNSQEREVKNKEMTLQFSFGPKTGKYSGPLNENGLPEGKGAFSSENSSGIKWTYTGDFVNGTFEGDGRTDWENGACEWGIYHDGVIQYAELTKTIFNNLKGNPDKYDGYAVSFVAKVFNVVGIDEDGWVHFQVYQDIENSENAMYVYASTSEKIEEDQFVRISGLSDGLYEGTNAFGGKISQPTIYARECELVSYTEAVSKTIKEVPVNETQTQYGYSITVQKVEFAEKETRIYIKVENGGKSKFSLYEWDVEVEQDNKQYEYQTNYDADYPELKDDLRPGNTTEGIITFPALKIEDFKIYIEGSSDDWNEDMKEMEFVINVK